MKRKSAIIVSILIMCIGFATISTTLIINGSAKISENTDDFSVIFTAATLDGQDVYDQVMDDTKKIITFETSDLKALNQTSILTYEVTNNSANYDAEVQVNCKAKDDAEAKYTNIKNELDGNTTKVLAKKTLKGTLTVTLNKTATEEVKEEYIWELTFNEVERSELGQEIPDPVLFSTDSWETIQKAVQVGKIDKYNVGDTRDIDLGSLGTHTLRIANMSECTNGETSETACGFVVEFADIILNQTFNSLRKNAGGWKDSEPRIYVNETIYNAFPSELQKVITNTKVISSHGNNSGESNFETLDKLYLFSSEEVNRSNSRDNSVGTSRQLDYYKNQNVVTKRYNGSNYWWWLRSADSTSIYDFLCMDDNGNWRNDTADHSIGVSPAFRIA